MKNCLFFLLSIFLFSSCGDSKRSEEDSNYQSEDLIIEKVSDRVYRHVSYLNTQDFGKVACNGMIVVDGDEALVFDTPTHDSVSRELIGWITDHLGLEIVGVVPTHFHQDCLGGLEAFHQAKIPSFAYRGTIASAKSLELPIPQNEIEGRSGMLVGREEVLVGHFGQGHTEDNIVAYFPSEKVLFGGCLIKEMGAGAGNLEDANLMVWPATVRQVKKEYPEAMIVIPGHGDPGGQELLNYTINLFENDSEGNPREARRAN